MRSVPVHLSRENAKEGLRGSFPEAEVEVEVEVELLSTVRLIPRLSASGREICG